MSVSIYHETVHSCCAKGYTVQLTFDPAVSGVEFNKNGKSIEYILSDINMLLCIPDLFNLLYETTHWRLFSRNNDKELLHRAVQLIEFLQIFSTSKARLSEKMADENSLLQKESEIHIQQSMSEFAQMNMGGKFFRGTLVNIGYHLYSDKEIEYSDALAIAYELFQTAILIHDDIIDHATLRREKNTIPENYIDRWKKSGHLRDQEALDVANSMALCAGDIGLFLANQKLIDSYSDDKTFATILKYFSDVALKTIKGEIIDVIIPFEERHLNVNIYDLSESILEIYRLKTAWYTVIGPLCSGALLGGCKRNELVFLEKFAEYLGIAFQIKDDILGVFNKSQKLGKDLGSDISEFKITIMYSYVKSQNVFYEDLLMYYGKPVTPDTLKKVQNIFICSGALDYAEKMLNSHLEKAINILQSVDFISEKCKNILYGIIWYLKSREK